MYFNENVFKKDKLKELSNFVVKALIRYHIMLFVHTYILHDKIDNVGRIVHAIDYDIEQISNGVNLLTNYIN